jgi:transcriptional regulator with XRE-family HTH domain
MWSFNRERLVALRESKGINQDEFGRSIGTIKQHVSLWETGKSIPSIHSLIKICNTYDIDIRYFFAKSANNNCQQLSVETMIAAGGN